MDELSSNQEEADTKVTLNAYSILKNINPEKYAIIRSHSGDINININATFLLVTFQPMFISITKMQVTKRHLS